MAADSSTSATWEHLSRDHRWTPAYLDNPLWKYACKAYSRPLVRQNCLSLQEDIDADINLLLSAGWCASLGLRIPVSQLSQTISIWRTRTILPFRALRIKCSGQPPLSSNGLKKRLLDIELFLEQVELSLLYLSIDTAIEQQKTVTVNSLDFSEEALCYQNLIECLRIPRQSQHEVYGQLHRLATEMATD